VFLIPLRRRGNVDSRPDFSEAPPIAACSLVNSLITTRNIHHGCADRYALLVYPLLRTHTSTSHPDPALLSVYDKTGLLELARGLADAGVRLLGSGGTAKKIREAGIPIECALAIPPYLGEEVFAHT
jgi:hypothetical protein